MINEVLKGVSFFEFDKKIKSYKDDFEDDYDENPIAHEEDDLRSEEDDDLDDLDDIDTVHKKFLSQQSKKRNRRIKSC